MSERPHCPNCSNPLEPQKDNRWCSFCKKPLPFEIQSALSALQDRKRPVTKEDEAELLARAERIICTTAPTLEGYRIAKTLDVITAECVFGMNIVRDFFASVTDLVGGRSEASQSVLRDARKTCLWELRKEAAEIGADAVIAIDLDYNEFSGGGKSMLFLVASGTAVKLAPRSTSTDDRNQRPISG